MSMDWIVPNFSSPSPYFPPPEVVTYDLHKEGRIKTPIHEDTKLVDRRALMLFVRSTVIPEYNWRSPVENRHTSNHHLHWPNKWYENKSFRNHGSRRTTILPVAHRWIHELTIPPDPVNPDVEHEYLEGRLLADELRTVANHPLFLGRETLRIHKEVYDLIEFDQLAQLKKEIHIDLQVDLEQQLDTFGNLFEQAKAGPEQFQVIDYSQFQLRNVSDMMKISRRIVKQVREEAEMDQRILDGDLEALAA